MSKTVVITATQYLKCACEEQPSVILCLTSSDLLAPIECPDAESFETYERTTLEGTLTRTLKRTNDCGEFFWQYFVEYDENLLADPDTALLASQVSGLECKGCLGTWVQDIVGNDASLVRDEDGNMVFTSAHGCVTEFIPGGGDFTVEDTDTIDLDYTGSVLSANAKISAQECNILRAKSDGLFAEIKISQDLGNLLEMRPDGLYLSECALMNCCNNAWIDFSDTAVVTVPGTGTPTIDEAKYKRVNGVVFIKFAMRVTLAGTTGISVRLRPPVAGVPDDDQAAFILNGLVNGVKESLNWRYDEGTGDLIFFRDAAATITNGDFEVQLSDFYEEVP